ncbi:MAG TPA: hypothetical protein VF748_07470 [Candidatus Acidoferrum sp.]
MAKIHIYRSYRFIDKDPIIDALKTVIRSEESLNNHRASVITGVSSTTFHNWFEGPTRAPQNASVCAAAGALGYVRRDELNARGEVVVGFVKARKSSPEYQDEIKAQADWLLKQGKQRKRRPRKKANGR